MPKGPSTSFEANFGVWIDKKGSDGKQIFALDGKKAKEWHPMYGAQFADGREQSLYFPDNHPQAGLFKGMGIILEERGIPVSGLTDFKKAQCAPSFASGCPEGAIACCCRRILYNQPDFASVESYLETVCRKNGFPVLFLPKFHCKLNFIEQCWGWAKQRYREKPSSSKEVNVKKNAEECLEAIPLETMCR
jgi:hypothetical protein